MDPAHPKWLRRIVGLVLTGVALAAGFAAAAVAAQTITIPGTTVTVKVEDDGSIDAESLKDVLPPGVTLPEGITLPQGMAGALAAAAASGLVPTTPAQVSPTPAQATPTAATTPGTSVPTTPAPAQTPDPATTPAPSVAGPIPGLPSLGGPAPTTATTTAAGNKTGDTLATLLLVLFGGLLLALGLGWAGMRAAGSDPDWIAAGRHRSGEAAWRASAGWADFRDWLRSPR